MNVKYKQVYEGDWITPRTRRNHKVRCCDCGLIHRINWRVRKGKLQYQVFLEDKATWSARHTARGRGYKCQPRK